MAMYMISYDLRKVRNYEPLWAQLRAWECKRVLESLWLADLRGPAAAIRDILLSHTDGDDGVLVVQLQSDFDWAFARVRQGGASWLQSHSP
jgi:hypothetical protein